ncbi:hypothetical protein HK100_009950 [Physocladia obscura]|uniref:Uncharacterized protein n=1 Tax=Physocladia obscura TaxID=109957 RepID=A0AAD5T9W0_9FUNG|nr:hypothetical protein HK100_009950 [Physocladia obscura]
MLMFNCAEKIAALLQIEEMNCKTELDNIIENSKDAQAKRLAVRELEQIAVRAAKREAHQNPWIERKGD